MHELPVILAMGQFDGIHRGHQAVLRAAAAEAEALGGVALCLTFSPHVQQVLNPERAPLLLATDRQNERAVRACGLAGLLAFPFSREWAGRGALDFLRVLPDFLKAAVSAEQTDFPIHGNIFPIIGKNFPHDGKNFPHSGKPERGSERVRLAGVAVGANFTFGCGREGTALGLAGLAQAAGLEKAIVVPPVQWKGADISSSRIRAAVEAGDMEAAEAMLGRPFALEGTIVHGRGEGRQNGLPTANVRPTLAIRPRPGVYAARLSLENAAGAPGGAFVPDGTDEAQRVRFGDVVEVHVAEGQGDWYGREADVVFRKRMRGFMAFASEAEAAVQIRKDIEEMRAWW